MALGVSWDAPAQIRVAARDEQIANEYRRQPRIEGCACGGLIAARPYEQFIVAAVNDHQRTPRHVAWSRLQGFAPAGVR